MGTKATDVLAAAEPLSGPYLTALGLLAGRLNIWLSVGGFPESVPGGSEGAPVTHVYNTHVLIAPSGKLCEPVYRKIHLFDCPLVGLRESATTAPGGSVSVIDTGFANIGLSICYGKLIMDMTFIPFCLIIFSSVIDLRFPELYASMSGTRIDDGFTSTDTDIIDSTSVSGTKRSRPETRMENVATSSKVNSSESISVRGPDEGPHFGTSAGADIVLVPSAFTVPTGKAHWLTLLRARAIENQVYVVAAAQCGRHNERRESYGHSVIIDPWGDIGETPSFILYLILASIICKDCLFVDLVSECSTVNTQSVKPPIETVTLENASGTSTVGQIQLVKHRVTEDGEICYGSFDRAFLSGVRDKMPIQVTILHILSPCI